MTVREFHIIDSIQRECIESWGLVQDIESTADYFGISRDMQLPGQWAFASRHLHHDFSFIRTRMPPISSPIQGMTSCIYSNSINHPPGLSRHTTYPKWTEKASSKSSTS